MRRLAALRRRQIDKLNLRVQLLETDRSLSHLRRREAILGRRIKSLDADIERFGAVIERILRSRSWKVGDLLVDKVLKRTLRARNRGLPWAPEKARRILRSHRDWRVDEKQVACGEMRLSRLALQMPARGEKMGRSQKVLAAKQRACAKLTRRLASREDVATLLEGWRAKLGRAIAVILGSWRWRVARTVGFGFLVLGRREERDLAERVRGIGSAPTPSAWRAGRQYARDLRNRMLPWSNRARSRRAARLLARRQRQLVSVIMPTWNRAGIIRSAIASVQAQTYANWELLVVDDGSTDETSVVVQALSEVDSRIRYLAIKHQGVSAARNAGLEQARGSLVAYLDSDNEWDPDFLLFMVAALEDSEAPCGYSAQRILDLDEEDIVAVRDYSFNRKLLLRNNYIDLNVFAHTRELTDELGGFDSELARWVDWDFILRLTSGHRPVEIPAILGTYKRSQRLDQITTTESSAYKLKVLNQHLIDWQELETRIPERRVDRATVVIPTYNGADMTRECLESIFSTSAGEAFDVVVVDNGSNDSTREMLDAVRGANPDLDVVVNYENYGFALGCNIGMSVSKNQFVVFLNNDTEVTPGWLTALLRPLRDDPTIGAVGPKLVYPDDTLQSGGMVYSDRSKIPYSIYQRWPSGHPAVNKRRVFQAITGACFAIRAEDYIRLRGFCPLYVNGCEDIDFWMRLRHELGKQVLYEPECEIVHLEGQTEGRHRSIRYNRELFVDLWGDRVEPDDSVFYVEDGFEVASYEKTGAEPHGPHALYQPRLRSAVRTERPAGGLSAATVPRRLGFCSIWHVRGVSFVTRQLAQALEGPFFRTHILARWESKRFTNEEPIYHPRVENGGDDPSAAETLRWAKANGLDAVIFVEVHPKDWKRVVALRKAGIKVIAYEHLDLLRLDAIDRYRIFDAILSTSFFQAETFRRFCPATPGLLVPWGIEERRIGCRPERVDSSHLRLVHVAGWGGINGRKNTHLVLQAFDQARIPNAKLKLHTQVPLARYGESAVSICAENGAIEVHEGTVPNVFEVYRDADLVLCPSKREGLGLPILEALASGVPALISDGYMMKQWVIPGEHAIVCPGSANPGAMLLPELEVDPAQIAMKLSSLAADPAHLEKLRQCTARDQWVWLWTWQSEVLQEHLHRMIEENDFRPAEDHSYLPQRILDFEARRRQRFAELA